MSIVSNNTMIPSSYILLLQIVFTNDSNTFSLTLYLFKIIISCLCYSDDCVTGYGTFLLLTKTQYIWQEVKDKNDHSMFDNKIEVALFLSLTLSNLLLIS